jgi:hypothetical protein
MRTSAISNPENQRIRVFCPSRALFLATQFVAAVLLPLSFSVGIAQAAGASRPTTNAIPMVLNCGMGKGLVRPKTLILACADANNLAHELAWAKWTMTTADATGVDTWNTCVPNCASSKKWDSASADFTLSHVVHTSKGSLFERLLVRITGHTPKGVKRTVAYDLAPVGTT